MSKLSIDIHGKGKTKILFFPGWTLPLEREARLFELLTSDFTVGSIKLPGYMCDDQQDHLSFSELLKDLDREVKRIRFESALPVGFSLGTQLALHYQKFSNNSQPSLLIGCPLEPYAPPLVRSVVTSKWFISFLRSQGWLINKFVEAAYKDVTENPQAVWPENISHLGGFDSLLYVLGLTPIVDTKTGHIFVYGAKDSLLAQAKQKNLKNLKIINDSGHNCMRGNETEIVKFLKELC